MNHKPRRRKPFVGCCGMCTLVKTDGTRKRRLTPAEIAARIGEREQRDGYTGIPCDEGWCSWCDYCIADKSAGERCQTHGCPDCGGPVYTDVPSEPLRVPIAERLAA